MEFPKNSKTTGLKSSNENGVIEGKSLEKVVTTEVIYRKPTIGQKFRKLFLGADFKNTTQYVAFEVLLPATRNMLFDAATKSTERFLYGESSQPRSRSDRSRSRVSYGSSYGSSYGPHNSDRSRPKREPYGRPASAGANRRQRVRETMPQEGDIVFGSFDDASLALERMIDVVDVHEFVSVADLHELCGLPIAAVDHKWGWYSLVSAEVEQVREGYIIALPSPEDR